MLRIICKRLIYQYGSSFFGDIVIKLALSNHNLGPQYNLGDDILFHVSYKSKKRGKNIKTGIFYLRSTKC